MPVEVPTISCNLINHLSQTGIICKRIVQNIDGIKDLTCYISFNLQFMKSLKEICVIMFHQYPKDY